MNEAPARISMIMQLTRMAPITLARNESQLSMPCHHAIASDPSTPQAAHSVAVAQPSINEANTSAISSSVGSSLADSASFSRSGSGGSRGGVFYGLASDQRMM